ncbi:NUDIX domain-containing protein [Patescibacteria group bacterium]|nr:NUDIX domain-containing protein [Patescibacteria group bacterium]MCL5004503.1 NUDIX domain-containing protein [Patescibacteria group bacterium]
MREISAGIIIYRKTPEGVKFLLLYHGGGYWSFAKGKIEQEERSFQTALREIREETGLERNDLKFTGPFKVYEKFTFLRGRGTTKTRVFKTVIFYLAETKKSWIRLSREHDGYGWFSYKEAIKILKHKDSQGVLTQANDFLMKPVAATKKPL